MDCRELFSRFSTIIDLEYSLKLPAPFDILNIRLGDKRSSGTMYTGNGDLLIFTDDVINNNRELLESVFSCITIKLYGGEDIEKINESTHPCLIDLLSRAHRVVLSRCKLGVPQWLRVLNIFSLERNYVPNLNFKILDIHTFNFKFEPLYDVRFVRHFSRLDCKKVFPNLIYCISCKTSNYPTIKIDDSFHITFDPAIITGISDTGIAVATSAILDQAIEAYDRFNSRGDRTKRAITLV